MFRVYPIVYPRLEPDKLLTHMEVKEAMENVIQVHSWKAQWGNRDAMLRISNNP